MSYDLIAIDKLDIALDIMTEEQVDEYYETVEKAVEEVNE